METLFQFYFKTECSLSAHKSKTLHDSPLLKMKDISGLIGFNSFKLHIDNKTTKRW